MGKMGKGKRAKTKPVRCSEVGERRIDKKIMEDVFGIISVLFNEAEKKLSDKEIVNELRTLIYSH